MPDTPHDVEQQMLALADKLYNLGADTNPSWRDGLRHAAEQIRFTLGWHLDGSARIEYADAQQTH